MSPAGIFERFGPYFRVATAIAPFVGAIALRLMLGENRLTRTLLSVSGFWLAACLLMAPFSTGMQQDLAKLGRAVWR